MTKVTPTDKPHQYSIERENGKFFDFHFVVALSQMLGANIDHENNSEGKIVKLTIKNLSNGGKTNLQIILGMLDSHETVQVVAGDPHMSGEIKVTRM